MAFVPLDQDCVPPLAAKRDQCGGLWCDRERQVVDGLQRLDFFLSPPSGDERVCHTRGSGRGDLDSIEGL